MIVFRPYFLKMCWGIELRFSWWFLVQNKNISFCLFDEISLCNRVMNAIFSLFQFFVVSSCFFCVLFHFNFILIWKNYFCKNVFNQDEKHWYYQIFKNWCVFHGIEHGFSNDDTKIIFLQIKGGPLICNSEKSWKSWKKTIFL